MKTALALVLLTLPALAGSEWSTAHKVGLRAPTKWKVLARDQGAQALVLEGPKVGAGHPRLVLHALGAPGPRTLKQVAAAFDSQLRKRSGWHQTAFVERPLGEWSGWRLAYKFQEGENARGRARVTVALIGGHVFVSEVSGPAKGFPSATFDQIEKSIEVKWANVKLAEGAKARFPVGWKAIDTDLGVRIAGPYGALVIFQQDDGTPPEGAKEGDKLKFLGKSRVAQTMTREVRGDLTRMRWVHEQGWSAIVIVPEKAWKDIGPGAKAIVASLKLPKKKKVEEKSKPAAGAG